MGAVRPAAAVKAASGEERKKFLASGGPPRGASYAEGGLGDAQAAASSRASWRADGPTNSWRKPGLPGQWPGEYDCACAMAVR
eukprot:9432520-Pyramimonas_sp.AAC.1